MHKLHTIPVFQYILSYIKFPNAFTTFHVHNSNLCVQIFAFLFCHENKILLCNSKLCIITKQFFYSTNFAYRKLYKVPITYAGRHKLCTQGSKFVNTFYHT